MWCPSRLHPAHHRFLLTVVLPRIVRALLGIIVGMSLSAEMGLLLGTGIMGAFTTMSAYSVDLVELFENGEYGPAASYLLVTLLGCPLLAYGGMRIMQAA